MVNITRRTFTGLLGAAGAIATFGISGCTTAPHVVVVGGGFGGATAAKYIRRRNPSINVTLIEPNKKFYTCPFSNTVIGGMKDMSFIEQDYETLSKKYGVNVVYDMVTDVFAEKNAVMLKSGGTISYDRLIVSPGIDMQWGAVEGYDQAASEVMPHAWKAGPQTVLLRKQLEAMPDGGVVLISSPPNPFRCPPGPYERAGLIAHYLKRHKKKSKVLILDSKDGFAKQKLFMEGWDKAYEDMIEWVPAGKNGKVVKVDAKAGTVSTDFDTFKPAVANIIPPQKAGAIAFKAGLTNDSGFCPVNGSTFESSLKPGIHVIGDSAIAGAMPKSGYSANSQAKVCADAVIAALTGSKQPTPSFVNTCYSLIAPDYGISVAAVYEVAEGKIASIKGAGGVSPAGANYQFRKKEADFAEGWYRSIAQDIWG